MNKKKDQINVLIVPFTVLQWVYEIIIPVLREKMNARFIVVASKEQKALYSEKLCTSDDVLYSYEELESRSETGFGLETEKEEAKARQYEDKLGITYFREIVQQDRLLSTPFLSHAPWSPYSSLKIMDNEKLVRKINGHIKISEEIIAENKIDLALVWPVTGLAASLAAVAEHNKIHVTYPYNSKYKGYCLWASSAYQDDRFYEESFMEVGDKEPLDKKDISPTALGFSDVQKLNAKYSFATAVKDTLKTAFFRLEFLVLDIMKFDFRSKKRLNFFRSVASNFYGWWFYKRLSSLSEENIDSFGERPFLLYAFAVEPEFSVQGKSKEFNDQSAIVRQIAMCLPAGYELVIKEHSFLGRRHLDFYTNLLKFPNVRMAHPAIRGVDLADKARAVATMAGSISLEASLLGKPVIEFSAHSTFSFLPNVTMVSDLHTLPEVLREAMRTLSEEEVDAIKRTSARVPEAIEKISFDGTESPFFFNKTKKMSKEEVERVVDLLIDQYEQKKQRFTH